MHHLPSRYIPCDGRLTASAYFKSTLLARGATTSLHLHHGIQGISILAPRMGSDLTGFVFARLVHISPHIGSDSRHSRPVRWHRYFNPRSPHGERRGACRGKRGYRNFNPRSPHGERLSTISGSMVEMVISIHAPRMGSDGRLEAQKKALKYISIHAPRMGSD